jgi:hypothetical protein
MLHNHESIKWFEKETVNDSEITSPDFMSMILEEGVLILSTRFLPDHFHILLDSAFVHHNLQLE